MRKILFKYYIFLSFLISAGVNAQPQLSGCFDIGKNNVSKGAYIRTVLQGSYTFEKNKFESGLQLDLKSTNEKILSGYYIKYSRQISIKNFPFELRGFYLRNSYSKVLYESDFALLLYVKRKHFCYKLGTNFRTYAFTKSAIDEYGITDNKKTHEFWNVMYLLGYDLKPEENKWNIGLTVTNIDYFLINQETNPFCNIHGQYKLSGPLTLFAEAWYKSAGNFNLHENYFGFIIRTGVKWDVK